ncbi:protein phosphatase 2C [Cavenderia fasciculata]|uniref:Protein phosphatase 2C n=1 Tax=Cavenderia fasciculata TaxID=261658 RepID=F4PHP0_CACFS|nr:protein phosphatase 2C [Cavenderia fasciculata]EGG25224.1 protein phosphatase 2C [Cavenderia fasciculata]|eukprot:XP_004363075.1 protein phosphatase 2C [Cavenderia fasciculata]
MYLESSTPFKDTRLTKNSTTCLSVNRLMSSAEFFLAEHCPTKSQSDDLREGRLCLRKPFSEFCDLVNNNKSNSNITYLKEKEEVNQSNNNAAKQQQQQQQKKIDNTLRQQQQPDLIIKTRRNRKYSKSTIGGIGVFEQSSKFCPLQLYSGGGTGNNNRGAVDENSFGLGKLVDLLPGKEILFNTRYVRELLGVVSEKTIKVDIPFRAYPKLQTVDFRLEGWFSSNIRNLKSKSHPSFDTITIEDNKLTSLHKIGSKDYDKVQQYLVDVELQDMKVVSGWSSSSLNHEGKYFTASMITFNIDPQETHSINNVHIQWTAEKQIKLERIQPSNGGFIVYNVETHTTDQTVDTHQNTIPISYSTLTNSNTAVSCQCNIKLQPTSSLLIYRFSTLSKLNIIHNYTSSNGCNNENSNSSKNVTIKSTTTDNMSSLSMSLPDSGTSQITSSLDLLSNISSHPGRVKPPGLQSFTAPPTFVKDIQANPIAAFVANAKQGPTALTGPKQVRRGPPMLGGSDIRLQRLASYNKVNNMWNLSASDFTERHTIAIEELEATALDLALNHVRANWWGKGRLGSMREIQALRGAVETIVKSSKIDMTYVEIPVQQKSQIETVMNSSSRDLGQLLNALKPKPASDSAAGAETGQSGAVEEPQRKEKAIDVIKLKWVIEEMLDGDKQAFPRDDDAHIRQQSWYHVDAAETKGERGHMEDKHIVIEHVNRLYSATTDKQDTDSEQLFLGVFDGHNGKLAADFTKTHLPYEIYKSRAADKSLPASMIASGIVKDIETTMESAYTQVDQSFLQLADRDDKKAGSTVATVIAMKDKLVVSNVGDTEVVLSSGSKASALSTMHLPTNEMERERVEKAGGVIIQCGTLRVNGVLAVTRAMGDRNLKDVITCLPDTKIHHLTPADQFLVIATDGLWDVMKHQEVVDYIIQQNQEKQPQIADRLVEEALRRNSKDNITVIIVYFKNNYQPFINQ